VLDYTIDVLQDGYDVYELRRLTRYRIFKNGKMIKGYNMMLTNDNYKLALDEARKPIVVKAEPVVKNKKKSKLTKGEME
jgi:hypothetical protein